MIRKGIVVLCNDEKYNYTIPGTNKTMYRHILVFKLPDGIQISGKYDSPVIPQTAWIVGQEYEFETEIKTMKNGTLYDKYKKVQKPREGFNDSPETRSQIERTVACNCAIQIVKHKLSKEPIQVVIPEVFAWIRQTAEQNGNDRQSSINAQAAIKLVCTEIESLKINNLDLLWNSAETIFKYIHNG